MTQGLVIKDLKVAVEEKPILRGVDLTVEPGKVHALMGPNGSGKSTLSAALLGHPKYQVTGGSATWNGKDLLELSPDERAREGIFLAFQYPQTVAGVTLTGFLRAAVNATREHRGQKPLTVLEFRRKLKSTMELLGIPDSFTERYLNEGFSGGEKKRVEILQLALLEPSVAILDETDSGLDIDALRIVSEGVNRIRQERPELGVLLITHYQRILDYITPDYVHVLVDGKMAFEGGPETVAKLEQEGYDWLKVEEEKEVSA